MTDPDIVQEIVAFRLSPQQAQPLTPAPGNVVQCVVALKPDVDVDRLREHLDGVVSRHEILRTTFLVPAGMRSLQQTIAGELAPAWSRRAGAEHESLTGVLAAEAAGVDPARGPVLRACVLERAGKGPQLILSAAAGVADEASLLLVLEEVASDGTTGSVGEEPLQYADYAEWRHELIAGAQAGDPDAQAGQSFWREQIGALPAPLRLAFGTARSSGTGATDAMALELAPGLQAGADVLEAAWHALLARMSGAGEVVVAGRCDGRAQPDLAGAIGPYAQRVPIATRVSSQTTFSELVDQVRRARAAATRWQDYGTAEQLAALTHETGIGFALASVTEPLGAVLSLAGPREPLALSLHLHDRDGRLGGELRYDSEAFTPADVNDLARRYALLVESALRDPAQPISALVIVDGAERAALAAAAASPDPAVSANEPVHRLFAAQAQRTPEALAVASSAGALTYAELDAAANRLANRLQALGSDAAPIGLCVSRTPVLATALLAIHKAGAAYLPLNGEHPAQRLSHQLRETGARLVVTEAGLLPELPEFDGTLVCLDRNDEAIAACSERPPAHTTAPTDLAYIMYTSGSTGTPKGVAVTHANLTNYARSILQRLGASEGEALRFGLVTAVSTDLGNTAIFPTLISGGCLQLFTAQGATHAASMAAELGGERLDALKITPSHLRGLLADGPVAEVLPRRWLVVGGEALSWELVDQVRALAPGCQVVNHYGPTEATVGCLAHLVEDAPRPDSATVPIGTPLAGARAYVLDGALAPVPPGVPGELCIGGVGVAAGYVAPAPQDAARFTTDPLGAEGERIYRTGDRVRRLRDGAIEFLGRLDEQVKIRGFRVEPGEIESALARHPAVSQAAVLAREDATGATLTAYLVAPGAPGIEELRAFLSRSLPDYMIPTGFALLPALPLTASGKVDRHALSMLADVETQRESTYVPPRDEIEAEIAGIWQELLGVERVGILDDFFALGGHSLLATQAIMRIRRRHANVSLRALLAAPTVATLAEVVRGSAGP